MQNEGTFLVESGYEQSKKNQTAVYSFETKLKVRAFRGCRMRINFKW